MVSLIALSWELRKIDFKQDTTRSEVYEDMLHAVYDRKWGDNQRANDRLTLELEYTEFARVLEEIALAAWHGEADGRMAKAKRVKRYCKVSSLNDTFEGLKTMRTLKALL